MVAGHVGDEDGDVLGKRREALLQTALEVLGVARGAGGDDLAVDDVVEDLPAAEAPHDGLGVGLLRRGGPLLEHPLALLGARLLLVAVDGQVLDRGAAAEAHLGGGRDVRELLLREVVPEGEAHGVPDDEQREVPGPGVGGDALGITGGDVGRALDAVEGGQHAGDAEHHRRDTGQTGAGGREQLGEPAPAHGVLDEVVRPGREREGDRHPQREQGEPVQARHGLVEQDDHGPVDEVQGVGELADPHERSHRHRSGKQAARRDLDDSEDEDDEAGVEEQVPPWVDPVEELEEEQRGDHAHGADDADDVEQSPSRGESGEVTGACRPHRQRQRAAGEDVLHPGVGAVVDARGVRAGLRPEQEHQGRGHPDEHDQAPRDVPLAAQPRQQDEEQRREDQVVLLLDGQGPHVAEGRGGAELGEVGLPGEDEAPVRHVEQAREGVALARLGHRGAEEEAGGDRRQGDGGDQRRQQAFGAPDVELDQVDRAPPVVLGEQQTGDEVARDDEEDVDRPVPAGHPCRPGVEQDDRDDGDAAQSVQRRAVAARNGALGHARLLPSVAAVRPTR